MSDMANYRVQNLRRYRLGVLRAAGVLGMVVALVSLGAAIRISDVPLYLASALVGVGSLVMFRICSRKLNYTPL